MIPISKPKIEYDMAKKKEWTEGALFLVPQADNGHSLGQVVSIEKQALNSVICAFYDQRNPDSVGSWAAPDPNKMIAILFTTPDLLNNGTWRVVDRLISLGLDRMGNYVKLKAANFVGAEITGSGNVMEFLNAFYGLLPWDDWHDPKYLDTLLVSPEMKPKDLKFKNQ